MPRVGLRWRVGLADLSQVQAGLIQCQFLLDRSVPLPIQGREVLAFEGHKVCHRRGELRDESLAVNGRYRLENLVNVALKQLLS